MVLAMANLTRSPELVGRQADLERAQTWLKVLGRGPAGLVISGEPGIGKTSVWNAALAAAEGQARVLTTRPVEAELPLGYVGLGDLLGPIADDVLGELPLPQGQALATALSLTTESDAAGPLLVGRATLGAIRLLAARGPLVIAVDDVQWLDRASARALAFAARRLGTLPVGFAVTVRSGEADPIGLAGAFGDGLIEIALDGLSLGAMTRLLRERVDREIGRLQLVRIHDRAAGNPFFGLQLARAGGGALPTTLSELVRGQLAGITGPGRAAIERVAVLGPTAASALGDVSSLDEAIEAGVLVETAGEVRFAHPLLAAGAYEQIPPGRRRELHGAAASTATGEEDRARHLALAAIGPDAEVAGIVERAARAARRRGAPEAAVELAVHAIGLTPAADTPDLDRRTMDQIDYLVLAASEPAALVLLDALLARQPRGATLVRALARRAALGSDPGVSIPLLETAVAEAHDDAALAAQTLAQLAWQRGAWAGDLGPAIDESLRALRMAEALGDDRTLAVALATAGLLESLGGRPEAVDHFTRAVSIADPDPEAGAHRPRIAFAHERFWRGYASEAAALLADERAIAELLGDEGMLMRLNAFEGTVAMRGGHWEDAERFFDAALVDARGYWQVLTQGRRGILLGRRGDPRALEDADEVDRSPIASRDAAFAATSEFGRGLIDLVAGDVAKAAARMAPLPELTGGGGSSGPESAVYIPETVAVLVEAGLSARAEALLGQLERNRAQLEPWGPAAEALCGGLLDLAGGNVADAKEKFETARRGFEELGLPWELAQTLLAEGRLLRRMGQRREAAASLERAVALFAGLGAEPARRRAAEELGRARPRPRRDDSLTAAETNVAALVAAGGTNREVAARLFTTVATVEAHLTRIYAKLGVRSRTELAGRMSDGSLRLESEPKTESRS